MSEEKPFDLLMWIGNKFNPTIENFVDEAMRLGCCRRVNKFPYGIKVGVSRVYLIHNEGRKGEGRIFGYFTIRGVEYIVGPEHDLPRELAERGVKPISVEAITDEPERGCGKRVIGALYLVSAEDMKKLRHLADKTDLSGRITQLSQFISYPGSRFRGYKYCWGDRILAGERFERWFEGIYDLRKLQKKQRRREKRNRR